MKNETLILLAIAGAVGFYLYTQSKKKAVTTPQNPNQANTNTTPVGNLSGTIDTITTSISSGADALDKVANMAGGW